MYRLNPGLIRFHIVADGGIEQHIGGVWFRLKGPGLSPDDLGNVVTNALINEIITNHITIDKKEVGRKEWHIN